MYIKEKLCHVINCVAEAYRKEQSLRKSKLSIRDTIQIVIGAEGGSLAKELHRAGYDVSASALTQRRAQIPANVFRDIFMGFNGECVDSETFHGFRLLAVDGTAVSIPRNPKSDSFVVHSGAPKGYNQLHMTPLYDILNKVYLEAVIQPEPHKDEIGALIELVRRNKFKEKTLIIGDRGFESYNLLAHLTEKENLDFLIRIKNNRSAMREVARLPMLELDTVIRFTISTTQTKEDKQKKHIFLQVPKNSKEGSKTRQGRWDFPSPYPMCLRIVRFQLDSGVFETIATSLPNTFTLEDIRELYHLRWGIESSFRDLKYTMGLVNLHGKSDCFAEQEMYAAMTMFNFTSRIAREAVIRQPEEGIYAYHVNFKMAVALCREYFRTEGADYEKLLEEIGRHTVPVRPDRQNKRDLKAKGFAGFTYRVSS